MKQSVKLSKFSIALTCVCTILLGGGLWHLINDGATAKAYVLLAMIVLMLALSLFYAPLSISVDPYQLCIHRSFRSTRIPLEEIEVITQVTPTMSEKRICGSGGWCGYWGWMSEPAIGKYFAYYGKASDCFLVRLRNGRQYLLGCQEPEAVVEYIRRHQSQPIRTRHA